MPYTWMKDKTALITIIIFWIGFSSFLATSIPHVAWLYASYEPVNAIGLQAFYTTFTSYGVAVGVDVMIAWLSFICARGKILEWGVTVLFITLLSALSQYANFLYAMAHDPVRQSDVWGIGIWGTSTGYLTPIIISCVPFFSLIYTFMLARLDHQSINLIELKTALENKKQARAIRDEYRNDETVESKAKSTVSSVVSVVKHSVKELSSINLSHHESDSTSTHDDIEAITDTAKMSIVRMDDTIPSLDEPVMPIEGVKKSVNNEGWNRSKYAGKIEALYIENPAITPSMVAAKLNCAYTTARKWLERVKLPRVSLESDMQETGEIELAFLSDINELRNGNSQEPKNLTGLINNVVDVANTEIKNGHH